MLTRTGGPALFVRTDVSNPGSGRREPSGAAIDVLR